MFSAQTLDFLFENRINNNKEWFDEHRPIYNEFVIKPLTELVEELAPAMLEIDSGFIVEPKIDRTISRIRRDTRFSHDKSIYRDVQWLTFIRNKKLYFGYPGFFFELSPQGFRYGCGYYCASPNSMESIRTLILNRDPLFTAALETYKNQDEFELCGDRYKRSKFPDQPEDIKCWLDSKCIDLIHNSKDFELLFSDKLGETLKHGFMSLEPIYAFLLKAEVEANNP